MRFFAHLFTSEDTAREFASEHDCYTDDLGRAHFQLHDPHNKLLNEWLVYEIL